MSSQNFAYTAGPLHELPRQLSISDVERLAKAGVQITFSDIAAQIAPDGPPPQQSSRFEEPIMAEAIWDRWMRSKRAHEPFYDGGHMRPWQLFASQHGDTVHVFVAPRNGEPFILTDAATIFPSDALMASLALHEKLKP